MPNTGRSAAPPIDLAGILKYYIRTLWLTLQTFGGVIHQPYTQPEAAFPDRHCEKCLTRVRVSIKCTARWRRSLESQTSAAQSKMTNEEPEQILLLALRLSLREVGGIPGQVQRLSDVKAEVLVSIVARSVMLIDAAEEREGRQLPQRLPSGAASRHRLCTQIAARLKELGFEGEIGYNQLLYPNESSTRAVLTWLVDRLPRTDEEGGAAQEALDASTALRQRMAESIGKWTRNNWRLLTVRGTPSSEQRWQSWTLGPDFSKTPLVSRQVPSGADMLPSLLELATVNAIATARAEAAALDVDLLDDAGERDTVQAATIDARLMGPVSQVDFGWGKRDAMPSLRNMLQSLESAAGGTERAEGGSSQLGRLAHAAWFKHGDDVASQRAEVKATDEAVPDAMPAGEDDSSVQESSPVQETSVVSRLTQELEKLGEEYQIERRKAGRSESEREHAERRAVEVVAELEAARKAKSSLEHDYVVRRKTLEMLPESATAIAKLREICAASQQRLAELEAEWERHRTPLERKIAEKRTERTRRRARARSMVDEMKRCRAEMQQMVLDVADKDERAKLLEAEYAKMPKNVNRTLYTYRIMDIIGSIAKQKTEIRKIIEDIRVVQKNNNKTGEVLRRTEAVADESVYSLVNAQKSDPAMVQSYRYLTDLRQLFETLVDIISETGSKDREARDYEAKRKQLQSRVDANNLKRILDDLQQVRTENENILLQLKASRSL